MSQLRLAVAVAAACAAALAASASAHAGTAFVDGAILRYDAAPGEVNAVSVTAFSDHFVVAESSAPLAAGAGCTLETPHTVSCAAGESSVQVSLGDEDDQYSGSGGSAGYELQIDMGPGQDTVDGLDLPVGATIHGGPGDDVLRGSDRFADTVFGDDGDDTLEGDDGASQFQGGDDTLDGGDGNDTLEGDFGADDLTGGPGVDLADYSHHAENVLLSLDDVANDGGVGEADNVHSDVENVFGTSGADVITGSEGANDLDGWWGDDTIQGAGGDDVLTADRGVDDLQGGPGNDQLFDLRGDPCFCEIEPDVFDGGAGTDSAIFSGRADGIHVSLDDVANDGASGEGDNVHSNIENVVGGAGNDVLVGDSQDQTLDGSGGDDVLDGGLGSDLLIGGTGTDTVSYEQRTASVNVTLDGVANDGGTGENDWVALDVEGITGGAAGDYLTGGDRRDTILGLGGPDVIDGGREEDVLSGGAGDDSITSRELEGFSDSVSCGAGTDSVTADSFDVIDPDCEYVNGSGPPPPPPPPPVPPPPAPPPPAPPPPPPPAPPVRCRVPKVTGLRLASARTKIKRAHCSVGRVRRARSRRVGRVLRQSPRAGAVRARGAKVSLVVGRR